MAKIDWNRAKSDYLSNPQTTYVSIGEKYGVSETAIKNYQKRHKEDWQKLRNETISKVTEKLPEKLGEKIAEVNARQAKIGQMLQGIGVQAFQEKDIEGNLVLRPKTTEEARLTILTGVTIERRALNIEKSDSQPVAIQINFGIKNLKDSSELEGVTIDELAK